MSCRGYFLPPAVAFYSLWGLSMCPLSVGGFMLPLRLAGCACQVGSSSHHRLSLASVHGHRSFSPFQLLSQNRWLSSLHLSFLLGACWASPVLLAVWWVLSRVLVVPSVWVIRPWICRICQVVLFFVSVLGPLLLGSGLPSFLCAGWARCDACPFRSSCSTLSPCLLLSSWGP